MLFRTLTIQEFLFPQCRKLTVLLLRASRNPVAVQRTIFPLGVALKSWRQGPLQPGWWAKAVLWDDLRNGSSSELKSLVLSWGGGWVGRPPLRGVSVDFVSFNLWYGFAFLLFLRVRVCASYIVRGAGVDVVKRRVKNYSLQMIIIYK